VTKALGLPEETARLTPAHRCGATPEGEQLFQARVLAYSTATWLAHANAIQVFVKFCFEREIDLIECTPYTLNLYLLHSAQTGKSFGSLQRFLNALSFVLRFFEVADIVKDASVMSSSVFWQKFALISVIKNIRLDPHKCVPFGTELMRMGVSPNYHKLN
jgi:hypothetical protein